MLGSGCWQGARWVCRDPVVWELFGPAEAYLGYILYNFSETFVKLLELPQLLEHSGEAFC